MTKAELGKAIYKTSHLTGSFELRSGAISTEYFDKYLFESAPELLAEVAHYLIAMLPKEFDYLAGLETGGIPLATAISLQIGKKAVYVRKKQKLYGTKKLAEGPDIEGKTLVIIEDVATSGGQVVLSAEDLRQRGAIIERALCVIDRESGAKEALTQKNIELLSLFTLSEMKEFAEGE